MSGLVDVIVPLQDGGSEHGDMELRYFLRSLERFGDGVCKVFVVCGPHPERAGSKAEFPGVTWLDGRDERDDCKDANIAAKLLAGAEAATTRDVVWSCDDCALLARTDLANLPLIQSVRGIAKMRAICSKTTPKPTKWQRRMLATLEWVESWSPKRATVNYDTHTPQRFNRLGMAEALRRYPFDARLGYTVNTYLVEMCGGVLRLENAVKMDAVKATLERKKAGWTEKLAGKWFLGYNDTMWEAVAGWLARRFPKPSRWERRGGR